MHDAYLHATGTIDYGFTNDYMFRAILQKNKRVLKALICSMLHLAESDIQSIEIQNPIILGEAIDDKTFILDIHVLLNNNSMVNLEMQVRALPYWEDRSLSYLCRSFDQLRKGEGYAETGSAIHIGILDYTPYEDEPEFYATFKLLNVKNHRVYSDKFSLNMLSLTQIDRATDEDKRYQIDRWARLFKATTWEELRMLSKNVQALEDASETLYVMNSDEMIREQCRAREDYDRLHNTINRMLATQEAQIKALTSENEKLLKLLQDHNIPYTP
jgi:predicted transposase/invertase (TIGR01784 family)